MTTALATRPRAARAAKLDRAVPYESSGPEQLSKQPAWASLTSQAPSIDWDILRHQCESRLTMLRAWRNTWMYHYSLLETYILPRRGIFINSAQPTPNSMNRGSPVNQAILDPTGTQAMRVCASGMMSGMMSPSRPWFKLKPAMMTSTALGPEVAAWFEEVETRMYRVMSKSNFYDAGAQMFEDLTTFGTGPFIIYEDDMDVIRCYVPCPGEYFLSSSNANRVESLYRQFVMTASQIVEMFGLENCPADIQGLWRTKGASLEVERLVSHAIEPNYSIADRSGGSTGVVPGDYTWREVYWLWGTGSPQPLSLRGFKDQPHVCPRWGTTSNDAYGRSVAMDVLPDIIQLQVMTARLAEAIEKLVRPPLLGSMELKNEPSSILPGHVTYVSQLGPDKGMRPIYTVNPQIREMMENMQQIQQRIGKGFFIDLFLSMQNMEGIQPRNELDIATRNQEKLQILGPVVERWQNEFAGPAIKRVFKIMERKKLLPEMPPELKGVALSLEYVSMMALAQRAASTAALERFAQISGNLSAVYPEAKVVLDPVQFLETYGEQLNIPTKVMRTLQQIQMILDAQAKQAQQQQMMQQSMAAVQGAEGLSNVQVGGGINAMQALLGNQAAGPTTQ